MSSELADTPCERMIDTVWLASQGRGRTLTNTRRESAGSLITEGSEQA